MLKNKNNHKIVQSPICAGGWTIYEGLFVFDYFYIRVIFSCQPGSYLEG